MILSQVRILLVDDHAVVRAGLRQALEEVPHYSVVGEAEDGANLITQIEAIEPDCLLIDVTMPNFEPISSIRSIRERYPLLKILVVSAYDDDVYVQGLLSAGVNGYHLKDQPLGDLRLAVERVMAGQRWVSSRLLDQLLNSSTTPTNKPKPVPVKVELPRLTKRQKGILTLLQKGYDNQRIAAEIGISVKTVENHLTRLYRLLNVQSRLEAVQLASQVIDDSEIPSFDSQPAIPFNRQLSGQGIILIVDDNSRFRQQLRKTISKLAPYSLIVEADTTAEALKTARQVDPDLILVDVVLGNEDGVKCTRELKQLVPLSRIILMTAYPDREFRQRGMSAGAAALLDKKDLDSNVLRGIIQDTMG